MEFVDTRPVVLVSNARSGHGRCRVRRFPCPVLARLPARQRALLARSALIPVMSLTSSVVVVRRRVVCARPRQDLALRAPLATAARRRDVTVSPSL
jgi:hypothetical protein